jgi:hypothetical protein
MHIKYALGLIVLAMAASPLYSADDGKVYKHVDKSGKITYSQTPPLDGKPAEKVDARPANRGHAGNMSGYDSYNDRGYFGYQEPYRPAVTSTQRSLTPQEQRLAQLQAECERNRGTDCSNPATLQYMESSTIPGGRRR